jgi:hypothetical protein
MVNSIDVKQPVGWAFSWPTSALSHGIVAQLRPNCGHLAAFDHDFSIAGWVGAKLRPLVAGHSPCANFVLKPTPISSSSQIFKKEAQEGR